jgi:cytochrome c-type biogenesis protein CcmH/NrfG
MVNTESTTGMVKKEVVFIAVLVALVAGFLGGVIYSSIKNPAQVAVKQSGSAPAGGQQSAMTEDQARKIFDLEKEVAQNPGNGPAWTSLGNIYYDTNQFAKSINAYNKALEINPQQPEVWSDLGVMYRRDKQPQEAIKAFDHALSIDPSATAALFNKGVVLIYDLNDKAAGIKVWEELVAKNPEAKAPNGQLMKDVIESAR